MLNSVDPQFSAQLQELYLTKLKERLALLESILPRLLRGAPRLVDFDTLERECHRLTGTGTTYGFPQITAAAAPLTEKIRGGLHDAAEIAQLLKRLIAAIVEIVPEDDWLPEPKSAEPVRPSAPPCNPGPRRPMILIADDDQSVRDLLAELLMEFATVQCASTGRETLEAVRSRRFDVILLDHEMPDADGFQILSNLRPLLDAAQTSVMMITALGDPRRVAQLLGAGAKDYVIKPFVPQNLVRRIKGLLGNRTQTVLLADDDPLIRAIIRSKLQEKGVGILLATNGAEALSLVRQTRPDVVVLDLGMPRMDGLDVLSEIRRDPAVRATPVMLLSARCGDADIAEGLRCGADDYIPKPFLPDDVVSRCIRRLAAQRAEMVLQ